MVSDERSLLCWEDDCACEYCEADRALARNLGVGRMGDNAMPVDAIPPLWMTDAEAAARIAEKRREGPNVCEVCGSAVDVRAYGLDQSLLCAHHYAEAERNYDGAVRWMHKKA